jgi:hypothetical protein
LYLFNFKESYPNLCDAIGKCNRFQTDIDT